MFSAIRQYSLFDYASTFLAFLFFAMPMFWFAVLLKEFVRHQVERLARRSRRVRDTVGSGEPEPARWVSGLASVTTPAT